MTTHAVTARLAIVVLGLGGIAVPVRVAAQALGSGFTYQGQLTDAGVAANGLYDLQACLYASPVDPAPIQCAPDANDVPVQAGVFTIEIDFGATAFVGQRRYIELRVRPGASSGPYTVLSPRQSVRAAPEALRANAASAAPWAGLTGVPAGFADGVDDVGSGGTVTSITAGAGLSGGVITASGTIGIANGGVGGAQIASGAVGSAQLADGGVAAADVAANSLGAAQIAADAVGASELANSSVDTSAVQDAAITGPKIAPNAVGAAQIDASQVQARIVGDCGLGGTVRGVNANGSLVCADTPGTTTVTPLADVDTVPFSSAAVAADGIPIIAYSTGSAPSFNVATCSNLACTSFTIETIDNPTNDDIGNLTMVRGNDGRPVIGFVSAGTLKVARCNNGSCSSGAAINVVDSPASQPSITLGADGWPILSYLDPDAGTLKMAKCSNSSCSSGVTLSTVDNPANAVGGSSAIAVGPDARPIISYRDDTAEALKVAKCATPSCSGSTTITTVDDPANSVGFSTTVLFAEDGVPIISYRDETAGALKVAKCANAACTGTATITVVDSIGDVGVGASMAIGTDGRPVISHVDRTERRVRLARCANPDCTGTATVATVRQGGATTSYLSTRIDIGRDGLPIIVYRTGLIAGSITVAKCGSRGCQ